MVPQDELARSAQPEGLLRELLALDGDRGQSHEASPVEQQAERAQPTAPAAPGLAVEVPPRRPVAQHVLHCAGQVACATEGVNEDADHLATRRQQLLRHGEGWTARPPADSVSLDLRGSPPLNPLILPPDRFVDPLPPPSPHETSQGVAQPRAVDKRRPTRPWRANPRPTSTLPSMHPQPAAGRAAANMQAFFRATRTTLRSSERSGTERPAHSDGPPRSRAGRELAPSPDILVPRADLIGPEGRHDAPRGIWTVPVCRELT